MPLSVLGVPNTPGPRGVRQFAEVVPIFEERNFLISGITKDAAGAALAGCTCDLINSATKMVEQTTISDASGAYSFVCDKTKTWKVDAYKAGASDVAGCSVNTLVPA